MALHIFILKVICHFNLEEVLPDIIDKYINSGRIKFLFNFEKAITVNSPAVATILTQTEKIVDDHGGRLSVIGLSSIYEKVFEMVGVFLYASLCTSEAEAIEDLKD